MATKLSSVIFRFFATIGDWLIGYFILCLLQGLTNINLLKTPIGQFFKLILPKSVSQGIGDAFFIHLFMGILIGTFLRVNFALLTGSSPWEKLLGIKVKAFSLNEKVAQAFRLLLSSFSLFLWPIDFILVFIQGETFGERVSGSKISWKGSNKNIIAFVLLIMFVIFSFSFPFFVRPIFNEWKLSFQKVDTIKLDKDTKFEAFKDYQSRIFHFKAFSDLGQGRFEFIPSFEITKIGNQKKSKPVMNIYDHKHKVMGKLKRRGSLPLKRIIALAAKGNPLFNAQFPRLAAYRKNGINDPKMYNELDHLLRKSFELTMGSFFRHALTYGPFIRGYINLRNAMLEMVTGYGVPEIDIIQWGNHPFLRFRQISSDKKDEDYPYRETLIPLQSNELIVFEYFWGKGLTDANSRKDFEKIFFATCDWFFNKDFEDDLPQEEKDFTPFHILDYYLKGKLKKDEIVTFIYYTQSYMLSLAKRALENKDEKLQNQLIIAINRLQLASEIRNQTDNDVFSGPYLSILKKLRLALKSQDSTLLP